MPKYGVLIFFLFAASSSLFPQIPLVQREFFVRVERQKVADESACVIVYNDGEFHAEHTRGNKTDVWEDAFDDAQFERLGGIVNAADFKAIDHPHSAGPMRIREWDLVSVDVVRGNDQQQIRFDDPEARKPYAHSLDPLLKWFAEMQKFSAGHRTMATANRCLPGNKPAPAVVSRESTKSPGTSHIQNPTSIHDLYFLWIYSSFASPYDHGECLIVHEDGEFFYQVQKHTRDKENEDVKAADGKLTPEEMASLGVEIARPELANSTVVDPLGNKRARERETISTLIKREGYYQHLNFTYEMGVSSAIYGERFATAQSGHSGDKEVGKLRDWIKQNMANRPLKSLTTPSGQCY